MPTLTPDDLNAINSLIEAATNPLREQVLRMQEANLFEVKDADIVNRSITDATAWIIDRGGELGHVDYAPGSRKAPGTVIHHEPGVGWHRMGTVFNLIVAGSPPVPIMVTDTRGSAFKHPFGFRRKAVDLGGI